MRYRPLGQSGLLVSVVGLGCNNFGSRLDVDGTRAVVDAAIDAGYIRRAVTESLRRLRTDYIDLYQMHVPDPVTSVEETIAALHELVAEGKVRYIGHSNFSGWQLADAAHLAARNGHTPFVSAQNHWSLLERQAEAEV